jgi:hypothetical protein
MRIRIDFAEAVKYTKSNGWLDFINHADCHMNVYEVSKETGKEIENVLIEDYFNGADKAVIYIGVSQDNE